MGVSPAPTEWIMPKPERINPIPDVGRCDRSLQIAGVHSISRLDPSPRSGASSEILAEVKTDDPSEDGNFNQISTSN